MLVLEDLHNAVGLVLTDLGLHVIRSRMTASTLDSQLCRLSLYACIDVATIVGTNHTQL